MTDSHHPGAGSDPVLEPEPFGAMIRSWPEETGLPIKESTR